eukprot:1430941-Heterocapsa_arctica.AAC.1
MTDCDDKTQWPLTTLNSQALSEHNRHHPPDAAWSALHPGTPPLRVRTGTLGQRGLPPLHFE